MSRKVEDNLNGIRKWLSERHVGQAFQPAIHFPEVRPFTNQDVQAVKFYRRKLPHWELEGSTYFVTFRVRNNLGTILQNDVEASVVEETLWFGFGARFILHAYVIMPDHIHVLFNPFSGWSLAKILQGIKGFSARQINKSLGRTGAFWQAETFDHLIRGDEDWLDKFTYIHNNPVAAKLVEKAQDYYYSSLVTMHSKGRLESLPYVSSDIGFT